MKWQAPWVVLTLNALIFGFTAWTYLRMGMEGGPRRFERTDWEDNGFSAATSGKLFRMRVQRKYTGARIAGLNQTPEPAPPASRLSCALWAVVTTISSPTTTVQQLDKLANEGKLCLVVVGDRKTPANFTLVALSSVYLSPKDQEKLPYTIIRRLPWNHFGRKNVGFMYAIHHGAQHIYDTDDDNELLQVDIPTPNDHRNHMTVALTHRLVNLYPCFGSQDSTSGKYAFSWPRGFPLESIKDARTIACTFEASTKQEVASVAVIQSLANNDPDVDAIYRLTRPLPIQFDSPKDPGAITIISRGSYMPYNAQATLHKYQALWGLLLPITVHGRVSDIWRSYFTQSLMWSANLTLAMGGPWVVQKRNAHSYLGDLHAEQNLYYQAGALVDFLSKTVFETPSSVNVMSMPALFEELYIGMFERGLLELADVQLAQAWLLDLQSIGYGFPKIVGMKRGAASGRGSSVGSDGLKIKSERGQPSENVSRASVFERPPQSGV